MTAGVYKITCLPAHEFYVGGSANVERRLAQHKRLLNKGRGATLRLQRLWDEFGEAAFAFTPIIVCRAQDVMMYEQAAISALKPTVNASGRAGTAVKGARHGDAQKYEVRGEQLSVAEIGDRYGLKLVTIKRRIKCGLRGDQLIAPTWESRTARYSVNGEQLRLSEIAERYGIRLTTLQARVRYGWSGDDLTCPVSDHDGVGERYNVYGKAMTITQISQEYGIPYSTVYRRIKKGLRDDALIGKKGLTHG